MRTRLLGNLEYTKHDTDGVGIRFFYLLWLLDLKPEAWSLCNSNLLGFFNQGAPKRNRKVPTINAQSLSKEAKQNSIKISCFGCPRVFSTAQMAIFKIILHRIISVVWLTNFLSEIRSLSNHDDETQFHILSVKPIEKLQCFWSLMIAHCSTTSSDGWGIVWVASYIKEIQPTHCYVLWQYGGASWSVRGIICPPGLNRVNWSAKKWGAIAPPLFTEAPDLYYDPSKKNY